MNQVMILPEKAQLIANDALSLPVIQVVDERTNIAAAENLKIAKSYFKDFEAACEPERVRLRKPLDDFLSKKKLYTDQFESYERQQKQEIGAYTKGLMDAENARRKAEAERLAAERAIQAEIEGKEAIPVQAPIQIEQSKARSEFVSSTVKMKAKGTITDRLEFISALAASGNVGWINLIFEKYNETKLNDFLKAQGIDGEKSSFPGVAVEMVPIVGVR
jgi:hypothetical protein